MKTIKAEINGVMKVCNVIENMGYNSSVGHNVMEIESDGEKYMIIYESQGWRNWTVQDRLVQ